MNSSALSTQLRFDENVLRFSSNGTDGYDVISLPDMKVGTYPFAISIFVLFMGSSQITCIVADYDTGGNKLKEAPNAVQQSCSLALACSNVVTAE